MTELELRTTSRLRGLSLLNDETFVTWLCQIRDQLLEQRASRSSKPTFRSVAEPILLGYLKAKRDVIAAWINRAFRRSKWDRQCVKPSPDDDKTILLFAEYNYELFFNHDRDAARLVFNERKARGYQVYTVYAYPSPEGGYIASDEDSGTDDMLANTEVEGSSAATATNILAQDPTLPNHSRADTTQQQVAVSTRIESYAMSQDVPDNNNPKKRKAENEQPSSDSSSSPRAASVTGFYSSLSDITESDVDMPSAPVPVRTRVLPAAKKSHKKRRLADIETSSAASLAAAVAVASLEPATDQGYPSSDEWEGVYTPTETSSDDSGDEDYTPSTNRIRRPGPTNATLTIIEPSSEPEFDIEVPINNDPVQLPEKPVQGPLVGFPPIWAESRQEVCESFEWFKNYQAGVYFTEGIALGYLLSHFSAEWVVYSLWTIISTLLTSSSLVVTSFWHGGKLIISHGGGKAASIHKNNGQFESLADSDQKADDKSVRALLKTFIQKRPLALVIDDRYVWFPYKLASKGCAYAVLGFYRIASVWAEKQSSDSAAQGYVVRYKFAFQWCDEQGEPWWIAGSDTCSAAPDIPYNVKWKCPKCKRVSSQVYTEGWMCLHPDCRLFWKLGGRNEPTDLHYSRSFLQLQKFPAQELPDIRPPPPAENIPDDGVTTTYHFTRGWHCRQCGRLSSRYMWAHWHCRNCQNVHTVSNGRVRTAREFRHQLEAKQFSRHSISPQSGVTQLPTQDYDYGTGYGHHVTFVLPRDRGRIHFIFSVPTANQQADSIFETYQREAAEGILEFRRWPMRAHKCRGTLLTNYFSQNTGVPYQYVGGTENTVTWDQAPTAVIGAREVILQRMRQALGINGSFNEVLSAAYMEKQKMAYHSDSEKGLGPTVASLSLGSSAYMHFRLHSQYSSELSDPSKRDVLSLFVRHGDVVVMEGTDVQKYYEHTVVPLGFRIDATARLIDSANHH